MSLTSLNGAALTLKPSAEVAYVHVLYALYQRCKVCEKLIEPGDDNTAPRHAGIRAHKVCVKLGLR